MLILINNKTKEIMFIQDTLSHTINFFDRLPPLMSNTVFEFLEGPEDVPASISEEGCKATIRTSMACKSPLLKEREAIAKRKLESKITFIREVVLKDYPKYLSRSLGMRLLDVPELHLERLKQEDVPRYIDFIKPSDLDHPIMRFTDSSGRRGIAMKIECNLGSIKERIELFVNRRQYESLASNLKNLRPTRQAVHTFFQYAISPNNNWEYSTGHNGAWYKRKPTIENLEMLIKDRDPEYRLVPSRVDSKFLVTMTILIIASLAIGVMASISR